MRQPPGIPGMKMEELAKGAAAGPNRKRELDEGEDIVEDEDEWGWMEEAEDAEDEEGAWPPW